LVLDHLLWIVSATEDCIHQEASLGQRQCVDVLELAEAQDGASFFNDGSIGPLALGQMIPAGLLGEAFRGIGSIGVGAGGVVGGHGVGGGKSSQLILESGCDIEANPFSKDALVVSRTGGS
jgi:hypothetical protein